MPSEYHNTTMRPASLEEETRTVIEEARMVLPGIQAFFGFQLIAIFNNRFHDLTHAEQVLHLIALMMLAVSIALIMTPAAYHRIAERGMVSRHFVDLASRFLEFAMFPLMLSISVDVFLLSRFILDNSTVSGGVALVTASCSLVYGMCSLGLKKRAQYVGKGPAAILLSKKLTQS